MNKVLSTNQLAIFESSNMKPIKHLIDGHLRCTFQWVLHSIVGYSVIVRNIKLHVKTKQKKTFSENETKRTKLRWPSIHKMFGSHNFQGLKNE